MPEERAGAPTWIDALIDEVAKLLWFVKFNRQGLEQRAQNLYDNRNNLRKEDLNRNITSFINGPDSAQSIENLRFLVKQILGFVSMSISNDADPGLITLEKVKVKNNGNIDIDITFKDGKPDEKITVSKNDIKKGLTEAVAKIYTDHKSDTSNIHVDDTRITAFINQAFAIANKAAKKAAKAQAKPTAVKPEPPPTSTPKFKK